MSSYFRSGDGVLTTVTLNTGKHFHSSHQPGGKQVKLLRSLHLLIYFIFGGELKQESLFEFSFICIFPLELNIYSFQLLNPVALSYCQLALEDGQNFLVQSCLQLFYNILRNCVFQLRTFFKIHSSFVEKSLYIHHLFMFTVLQIKDFLLRTNFTRFGRNLC